MRLGLRNGVRISGSVFPTDCTSGSGATGAVCEDETLNLKEVEAWETHHLRRSAFQWTEGDKERKISAKLSDELGVSSNVDYENERKGRPGR